jgi:tRNA (Thr-GGU) A37 N-methylase
MHYNEGFKSLIKPIPRPEIKKQPPKVVGLFSSRSPHRPNPIALSALKVINLPFYPSFYLSICVINDVYIKLIGD